MELIQAETAHEGFNNSKSETDKNFMKHKDQLMGGRLSVINE